MAARSRFLLAVTCMLVACTGEPDEPDVAFRDGSHDFNDNKKFDNEHGKARTFVAGGTVELEGAFSEDFGTNGRTCVTCHDPAAGWTITPELAQARFDASYGLDPLFRTNDGSTSPLADVSTFEAREAAYSLLLERGVIRVGMPMPDGAEFELVAIDDPYGYASANELSLFRRPLPTANLPFVRNVMWDGRVIGATLDDALADQANGATLGHAAALAPLTADERGEIVDFELGLFHAQHKDDAAGQVDNGGALGGPDLLAGATNAVGPFALFAAWKDLKIKPHTPAETVARREARMSIARGEVLFNTKLREGGGGPCQGCHNVANVGVNGNGTFFDVGVSAGSRRAPEVPLYTLRNLATGVERTTTDPGRALVTGLWSHVDRFKTPSLRGLAARAPYFHDGSAATLLDVIHHYEDALGFAFDEQEEADLAAFMAAL